jgi:hypothetical protein
MSNSKHWSEYAEHTYERYVAWMKEHGYTQPMSMSRWTCFEPNAPSEMIRDKVTSGPFFREATDASVPAAHLRAEFLDVVKGYVINDRNNTHGDAEDNFADIAALWNIVFFGKDFKSFTPTDVAVAMICVKLSRIKTSPDNLDHWHDMAGYAACGGGIIMRKKE